nr:hypothetical protein [Streptomyces sp. NRRL F-2664]
MDVAWPVPLRVPLPIVVALSLNVTVPVAVTGPSETFAVKVTLSPTVEGWSEDSTVVLVPAGCTVRVNSLDVAGTWVFGSVAVAVKVWEPVLVGVPEISPVAEFRASPGGRLPPVTPKAGAPVPPLVWIVAEYAGAWFTVASGGGLDVVISRSETV